MLEILPIMLFFYAQVNSLQITYYSFQIAYYSFQIAHNIGPMIVVAQVTSNYK